MEQDRELSLIRASGEWAKTKLEFLEKYLPAYLNATQSAYQRYYIDLFAGPGHNEIEGEIVRGSPCIALDISDSITKDFTEYFFVEAKEREYLELSRLRERYKNKEVSLYNEDCNLAIDKILSKLHDKAPTFVLADPTGAQLHWSTLEKLAHKSTEIFFNFPYYMCFQRLMPNNPEKLISEKLLDKVFGTPEWKDIYNRKIKGEKVKTAREILLLYLKRVKGLGYSYVIEPRLIKTPSGLPLYYLVFVSRHPVGAKIAKHIWNRLPDVGGQQRLFKTQYIEFEVVK